MKRGQAAGAAVLVAIIAVLLIGFIILVSPKERAELLDEDTSSDTVDDTNERGVVLLRESPGRVDYLPQKDIEHPLPVVNVYTLKESKVIAEKNNALARKSLFSEEQATFTFPVKSLDDADNFLLAFEVNEVQGRLMVSLNGELIFNGDIDVGNPAPLTLPKGLLKSDNTLILSVSSPGAKFWATNMVSLENLRVVADVTDRDAESASHTFLVSETEKRNMEKVVLEFQPTCRDREVGMLTIVVNGQELYRGIPDCDVALVPIEFSPDLVKQGENRITFRTEEGRYLLSHVLIVSNLKEVDFPTYYFELSHEQYEDVKAASKRLRLVLDFTDVTDTKYGEIIFNGDKSHFDTRELSVAIDVSDDVEQGANSVKVKPQRTVEIRELRAELLD